MSPSLCPVLIAVAVLAHAANTAVAQQSPLQDVVPAKPIKLPSRRELDRQEALELYGVASLQENSNRLTEALKTYEKALRLDPDSTAIRRSLIPLYVALDRQDDALGCCRRLLELDPGDYDTWYLYGRQLRGQDREADACAAFDKALACKRLKDRPGVALAIAYDLGTLREKLGHFKRAEAAFRKAAELLAHPAELLEAGPLTPQDIATQAGETYERIGRICLRAGKSDDAILAFKNAQAKDPSRARRLSLNLAEVLLSRGKQAEALRYVDHYLGQQPQSNDGYELKIKLLRALGRGDEVLAELEKHSANDRFNTPLRLLLAREYRKAGRPAQAERIYETLLKSSPEVDTYRGLFGVYLAEGEPGAGKLLSRLNRAVTKASPEDKAATADANAAAHARAMLAVLREDRALVKALLPVAHRRILKGPQLAYPLLVLLAVLAERTGSLDAAEELYRSCLDKDGKVLVPGDRRQVEPQVYFGLLKVLSSARKHAALIKLCRQALDRTEATNRTLFYREMAFAHMALGHSKEALDAISQAVTEAEAGSQPQAKKQVLFCRCNRSQLLAQAEKFKEAEAECLELLKGNKEAADVQTIRFALSAVYSLARQHDKAEEQLLAILEEDPNSARGNNDLGYIWADQNKNLDRAERMIRKALELDAQQRRGGEALGVDSDRDNAAYVDSLGWVLFRRGRLREAREQLEKAAALPDGADDPVVWDHLGDVCYRLKDDRAAVGHWKKALKLYEDGRRRADGRAKDIADKLKMLGTAGHP